MNLINNISKINGWQDLLSTELKASYFFDLTQNIDNIYAHNVCFPEKEMIFNAFQKCKLSDLKVVIIGQDPYHGVGQANGLSFSVNDGIAIPPSLRNIFKEINIDLDKLLMPSSGNLERWASQGVLLLNATLTVQKDTPNSHKHLYWQRFTDAIIQNISQKKNNVVFLLWGNFAIQKAKLIDHEKHLVLTSGHPSPMSANQGKWFGNKHFSQTNAFLKSKKIGQIDW